MEDETASCTDLSTHGEPDLRGLALAYSQISGSMQILGEIAEDTGDDRCWAVLGSLDSALSLMEPIKERA